MIGEHGGLRDIPLRLSRGPGDHDFGGLDDREDLVTDRETQPTRGRTGDDGHDALVPDLSNDFRHDAIRDDRNDPAAQSVARADLERGLRLAVRTGGWVTSEEFRAGEQPFAAVSNRRKLAVPRQLLHTLDVKMKDFRGLGRRDQVIHV